MSLNIRQINGNVKRKSCAPQQRKPVRTSQTKFSFASSNNNYNRNQNNELFDKGDGEVSETTSSLEDVSDSFKLQRYKYESNAEKNLLIYDIVTEPTEMDGTKQFEDLKKFLQYQTKPTLLVLKVLKSFIKMQEIGKYISRGTQAQIDLNIYQSPLSYLNEPLFTNYLDEVYAPLNDIYTIDVITKENERPKTSPFEGKSRNCDSSNSNLKGSLNTVLSITEENLHSSKTNPESIKYSGVSRIPKLILNEKTKNKCQRIKARVEVKKSPKLIRIRNEFYESEHPKTIREECCSLVNKGFKTNAVSLPQTQSKVPLVVKTSKIPIRGASKEVCKKTSGCSMDTVVTVTDSKTSIFQDAEYDKPLTVCASSKTIVTITPEEFTNESKEKLNDVVNPEQSSPPIEKPKHLRTDIKPSETNNRCDVTGELEDKLNDIVESEQPPLLLKEHRKLWIATDQALTNNMCDILNFSKCSVTEPKQFTKTGRKNLEDKLQRIRKTIKSEPLLGDAISPILQEAIFRTKQEMEQRKGALNFIGKTPEEPLKRVSNAFANKKKPNKKEKPKQTPKTNPVPKRNNKPIVKRPPEKHKTENWEIKTNIFERGRKPGQVTNKFRPKVSKFATFPRQYEDVKRNRNKDMTYVVVKSDSNRDCRYRQHHEPFKVVPIDHRPCENFSYTPLTKDHLGNCYSHALLSLKHQQQHKAKSGENSSDPSSMTDTATLLPTKRDPCTKKLDNSPLTKIIAIDSSSNKTQWYSITSKTDLQSDYEKEILYFNSDYASVDESNHEKESITVNQVKRNPKLMLSEWAANVQNTEKNLNELRLKIGRLATVLKEITDRRPNQIPEKNPALFKYLTPNSPGECCLNSAPESDKDGQ